MQKYFFLILILLSFSSLSGESSKLIEDDCNVSSTCKEKENKNKKANSTNNVVIIAEDESEDLTAYEKSIRRSAGLDPDLLEMAKLPINEPSSNVLFDPYLGLPGIDIIKQENGDMNLNGPHGNIVIKSTVNGKVTCNEFSRVVIANKVYCGGLFLLFKKGLLGLFFLFINFFTK